MDNYLTALQNGEKPDEVWKGFLEDQAHKTRESLSLSRNVAKLSIDEVFKWMFGVLDTAQRLELNDFKPLNNPAMDANIAFNGYATFVDADHNLHSLMLCTNEQTNERFWFCVNSLEHLERFADAGLVREAQSNPIFGLIKESFDDEQINKTIAVGSQFIDHIRAACVLESLTQIRTAIDPDELYLFQKMLFQRLLATGLESIGGTFSPLQSGSC